jgi:hypothetical protein
MTEEDEAFNEIERRSIAKKEAVKSALSSENLRETIKQIQSMVDAQTKKITINPYRNQVIEEVAQHLEKLKLITADALANHIREMKE